MYAIVKTGGKQYRVEPGQSLLVERLPVADGDTLALQPLLYVDGAGCVVGEGLAGGSVPGRGAPAQFSRGRRGRVISVVEGESAPDSAAPAGADDTEAPAGAEPVAAG